MNYIESVEKYFSKIMDQLYPIRSGRKSIGILNAKELEAGLISLLSSELIQIENSAELAETVIANLPAIKKELGKDITAIYRGDPAAKSHEEIILAYPGFYATAAYRIANQLYLAEIPLIPRIITEHAHDRTGIDIHPGATIGEGLCIDHGTGVVIGETTVIGKDVKIYQGVTLGALSITEKNVEGQRHPTIEDRVVLYAQATILGGDTVIGHDTIIGGNVWITSSVPAKTKIYFDPRNNITKSNEQNVKQSYGD